MTEDELKKERKGHTEHRNGQLKTIVVNSVILKRTQHEHKLSYFNRAARMSIICIAKTISYKYKVQAIEWDIRVI